MHHTYLQSACDKGKFYFTLKSNATITLREEETRKRSLRLQGVLSTQAPVPQAGGLTEGAVTARELGSVFLFPERFMQNWTRSACGPGLPTGGLMSKTPP